MVNEQFDSIRLIKRINDTLAKNVNHDLYALDITFSQIQMLLALNDRPDGSAPLKELEKYFSLAQSTTTGIAHRLEKKGLVIAYTDAEDKRIKHIQLTDAGKSLCRSSETSMEAMNARLFASFSPEEQILLKTLLQRMYDAIA